MAPTKRGLCPPLVLVVLAIACYCFATATYSFASSEDQCSYDIVETLPEQLEFKQSISFKPKDTYERLMDIINQSKKSLKIASMYVSLTAEPERRDHPSAQPGLNLMAAIAAASARGVRVEVVLDGSRPEMSYADDVAKLRQLGEVKLLNMTKLFKTGMLHSKFLIADDESFYVGSSNFDWRSYSQIKEIGIVFSGCPRLGADLDKIFKTYQLMADAEQAPALPDHLSTSINAEHPAEMSMDGEQAAVFMSSSPPVFNQDSQHSVGRTGDIESLVEVIDKAKKRVDVSVMNYNERTYGWPRKFWPVIGEALKRAASERRVEVRLLFSNWTIVKDDDLMWYKSLNSIQSRTLRGGSIKVKLFQVPSYNEFQRNIPFARVKHDKYMVTDKSLYISTSNWTPDYFIYTCGVGVIIEPSCKNKRGLQVIDNMRELFERDYNSEFATDL